MPLVKRSVHPTEISRNHLPGVGVASHNELELTTNGGLACVIMQLSSLSRHVEDMFAELHRESLAIFHRTCHLGDRVDRLRVKITQLNPTVEEVLLQDINMRKPFKSSVIKDQQIITLATRPVAISEVYLRCEPPPALQKLNPYRLDGKDSLKFYTDDGYFFELWRIAMQKESKNQLKRHKRGRQPQYLTTDSDGARSEITQKTRASDSSAGVMMVDPTLQQRATLPNDRFRKDPHSQYAETGLRKPAGESEPGQRKVVVSEIVPRKVVTSAKVVESHLSGGHHQKAASESEAAVKRKAGVESEASQRQILERQTNHRGDADAMRSALGNGVPNSGGTMVDREINSRFDAVALPRPSSLEVVNKVDQEKRGVVQDPENATAAHTHSRSVSDCPPGTSPKVFHEANAKSAAISPPDMQSENNHMAPQPSQTAVDSSSRGSSLKSNRGSLPSPIKSTSGTPARSSPGNVSASNRAQHREFVFDAGAAADGVSTKTSTPDSTDFLPLPPSPPPGFCQTPDSPATLPPPPPTPPPAERTPSRFVVDVGRGGVKLMGSPTALVNGSVSGRLADDVLSSGGSSSSGGTQAVGGDSAGGGEVGPEGQGGAEDEGALVRDTRSVLLSAIREGIQLRKVEERRQKSEKKYRQPGRLDVQTIMEAAFELRRKALEENDSEEGEEGEGEDELDGNWSDGD